MNNNELIVVVPGDIYNTLGEEEKKLVGEDYIVLEPEILDGDFLGLVALNVWKGNLPDDYFIRITSRYGSLPKDIIIKLQGAIVTFPKNKKGFYEDIFGLYENLESKKR